MRAPSGPRARCARGCAPRRAAPCGGTCAPTWPPREPLVSRRYSLGSLDLRLAIAGVAAEHPRRREFAQLMADHLLADEDGHVLAAVVDRDRVPDHLREDRRRPRPGADHLLAAGLVHP